jgi:hypothetical protein
MRSNIFVITCLKSVIFILLIVLCTACSGNNATAPEITGDQNISQNDTLPVFATSDMDGMGSSGYGVLGMYGVRLNPETVTAEITPFRTASKIGDFFVVDITDFMTVSPCTNCLIIKEVKMDDEERLIVKFGLKHPYAIPTTSTPPALNRKDLHVFDVRGVIFMNPVSSNEVERQAMAQFAATRSDLDGLTHTAREWIKMDSEAYLVDACGYTAQLDNVVDELYPTDFNTHPFKLFFEYPFEGNFDPNSTTTGFTSVNSARGYNVMRMGETYNFVDYTFDIGNGETFDFLMVISCSFGQSAKGAGDGLGQRLYPRYFCPQFNRKEAWKVQVVVENNQLKPNDPTSSAEIVAYVRDWQESDGRFVSPGVFDPMTSRAGDYNVVSGVREVTVDIPGLKYNKNINPASLPSPQDVYLFKQSVPESGDGSESNPLVYRIHILNQNSAGLGSYMGLVAVRDQLEGTPKTIGTERDGVSIFPISDFSTYVPFTIDITLDQNPFDPVQDTVGYTNTVMTNIRFDRNNVDQYGSNMYMVYRGTLSGIDSIWSQVYDGSTWGIPQQISNNAADIAGHVKAIAVAINGEHNPIVAWLDGNGAVIYAMGVATGTSVDWSLGRKDTGFKNPLVAGCVDIAIAGDPTDANRVSIVTNSGETNQAKLYESYDADVYYSGWIPKWSDEIVIDYYYDLYPRPYVDVKVDADGFSHSLYQMNYGTRQYLMYSFSKDIYPTYPGWVRNYVANVGTNGYINWPRLQMNSLVEPVVIWEDEGGFNVYDNKDIALSYKKQGSSGFTSAKKINVDESPIVDQMKPDFIISEDNDNAWVVYEDNRYGQPQVFMTVMNIANQTVLINDFQVNTDSPPYHDHRVPQFTIRLIPGYFPQVHGFWLDYGGPNMPFIGHNDT